MNMSSHRRNWKVSKMQYFPPIADETSRGIKMANAKYNMNNKFAVMNRKKAGKYLKKLREKANPKLTQRRLSTILGIGYYTFISQIEAGASRLPPDKVILWAEACNANVSDVGKTLLKYYDPYMYQAIFRPTERLHHRSTWSEHDIRFLRYLWEETNLKAAEIGGKLGKTKNAILGKVYREQIKRKVGTYKNGSPYTAINDTPQVSSCGASNQLLLTATVARFPVYNQYT